MPPQVKTAITISIHAPTRGATKYVGIPSRCSWDFNPRSHEGSDEFVERSGKNHEHFNPRSHEGSDRSRQDLPGNDFPISIHAPTRGATEINPFISQIWKFQSTLPRGERRCIRSYSPPDSSISIHAPTRGATAIFAKKFSFLSAKIV